MRLSARRHGCRYAFTEMVDAGSLVFGNHKTMNLIKRAPSEDFLGIQLVGSEPEILKKAAEIINGLDFSVLDFNLGCPGTESREKGRRRNFRCPAPRPGDRSLFHSGGTLEDPGHGKDAHSGRE